MIIKLDMDGVLVDTVSLLGYIPVNYDVDFDWTSVTREQWANLPKSEHADGMIKFLRTQCYDIMILTQTCSDACTLGKMDWLKKHYPKLPYSIVSTKEFETGLLIDDNPKLKFSGRQILWPQPYNKAWRYKDMHINSYLNIQLVRNLAKQNKAKVNKRSHRAEGGDARGFLIEGGHQT